jgi:hypothetical protein
VYYSIIHLLDRSSLDVLAPLERTPSLRLYRSAVLLAVTFIADSKRALSSPLFRGSLSVVVVVVARGSLACRSRRNALGTIVFGVFVLLLSCRGFGCRPATAFGCRFGLAAGGGVASDGCRDVVDGHFLVVGVDELERCVVVVAGRSLLEETAAGRLAGLVRAKVIGLLFGFGLFGQQSMSCRAGELLARGHPCGPRA